MGLATVANLRKLARFSILTIPIQPWMPNPR